MYYTFRQRLRRFAPFIAVLLVAMLYLANLPIGFTPRQAASRYLGLIAIQQSAAHALPLQVRERYEILDSDTNGAHATVRVNFLTPLMLAVNSTADHGVYLYRSQTRMFPAIEQPRLDFIKTPLIVTLYKPFPWIIWIAEDTSRPMANPPYDITANSAKEWLGKTAIPIALPRWLPPRLFIFVSSRETHIALWVVFALGAFLALFTGETVWNLTGLSLSTLAVLINFIVSVLVCVVFAV